MQAMRKGKEKRTSNFWYEQDEELIEEAEGRGRFGGRNFPNLF